MVNVWRSFSFWAVLLILVGILFPSISSPPECRAELILQSYDPLRHDRFQNNVNFIGQPYDWSGVGRENTWATLISPSYFVSATHAHPAINSTLQFHANNDPSGPVVERAVIEGTAIDGSDLWLGKLASPADASIATYPILQMSANSDFVGQGLFTYGLSNVTPSQINMRLGRNVLDVVLNDFSDPALGSSHGDTFTFDFDATGGVGADESLVQSGDSGAPTFTIVNGSPALLGIHWFQFDEGGVLGSGDTLVPSFISSLNAAMVGESVTIVTVPEPATLVWSTLLLAGAWVGRRQSRRRRK